ncbi:hypothetical protein CDL15_Pgr028710 [Punica granatum]|uniref:Uncharacterized protein n=1 Tax=Punica granatum TaxID=22663 RepID=A0A218VYN4_PUNGR|nr:hypothetical protein CDL15_Pgr028710 [Punica granatum]
MPLQNNNFLGFLNPNPGGDQRTGGAPDSDESQESLAAGDRDDVLRESVLHSSCFSLFFAPKMHRGKITDEQPVCREQRS